MNDKIEFDFQPGEIIPKRVENENKLGVPYNLDQYGFQAPETYILEAGDVPLVDVNGELLRLDTDLVEDIEKRILRNYESALALKNKQIAYHRHSLLPFHYRRHNLSPPYTCYIQLTVSSKGTKKQIQRYMYTKRLHEAAKQLNTILFGGRQGVIQVRDFSMPWCSMLRLPVGFKIRVKCIENVMDMSLRYNQILSLIDSSSFPLNKVTIFAIFEADIGVNDFHLPAIRSAKLLKIKDGSYQADLPLLLRTLPNQTVILIYSIITFQADEYFALARSWLNDKRPVGTCYFFPILEEEIVRELVRLIRTRMENAKRTKRCVTVSMGHENRLEVFYVPAKTHRNPEVRRSLYKWVLNMRVVRVR
ncbi:hypothetical protein GCK72_007339 [Caenorhabditis remanei]|uniref:Uncharacterized protein n=1 Tax=Caenorhabditis remanei TaxID=31234 RepID=A0A6A5HH42_CAERE|nr:hypothetical protein GCK72_007339 [Caenorhabditis remanei]KAF1767380.1 hypothetical protein GCK72_007339 [Caenorhabditis remanei]